MIHDRLKKVVSQIFSPRFGMATAAVVVGRMKRIDRNDMVVVLHGTRHEKPDSRGAQSRQGLPTERREGRKMVDD